MPSRDRTFALWTLWMLTPLIVSGAVAGIVASIAWSAVAAGWHVGQELVDWLMESRATRGAEE